MPDQRPPGWSVYGRIDRFVVACPECGGLIRGDNRPGYSGALHTPDPQRINKIPRDEIYRWRASRLRCPYCRTTYGVGLVLWRIANGGDFRLFSTPPEDQTDPVYLAAERAANRPGFVKEADPDPVIEEGVLDPRHRRPAGWGRRQDEGQAGGQDDGSRPDGPVPAIPSPPDDERPEARGEAGDNGVEPPAPSYGPGKPTAPPPGGPVPELGGWYVPSRPGQRLAAGAPVNLDLGACSCGEHPFSDPRCPVHGWE